MHTIFKAAFAAVSIASISNFAQAVTTDDDFCRNGGFPSQLNDTHLASYAGAPQSKLYFFGDMNGCPSNVEQCKSKSYVLPGDELIVGKQHGEWSCVWYQGRVHETVGWVLNRQLRVIESDEHPDWRGTWKQYDYPGYVNIARKADEYYVLGNTKWIGAQLADGTRVEHLGNLDGKMTIDKTQAHIGQAESETSGDVDCWADFKRLGKFLIVHDNGKCGGMNVHFDGVYTQRTSRK